MDPACLFCKVVARQIPANIVYEDDHVVAFRDIRPVAPTHVLVIPRVHFAGPPPGGGAVSRCRRFDSPRLSRREVSTGGVMVESRPAPPRTRKKSPDECAKLGKFFVRAGLPGRAR